MTSATHSSPTPIEAGSGPGPSAGVGAVAGPGFDAAALARPDRPIIVLLALVHLGALLAPWSFSWSALVLCLVLYAVTMLGVTLGMHRLLAHKSYRAHPALARLLAFFGALSCQGGPIEWAAIHRLHHARADREGDPHHAGRGFWWSHFGWLLRQKAPKLDPALRARLVADLDADPFLAWLNRWFIAVQLALGLVLYAIGGWSWVVWGVFVRLVLVYHATFLVNSATHRFGYRSYDTRDDSTNCWWVAWLTFGEGWHNNHHAFPSSARQGLTRGEVDVCWIVLRGLVRLGWARDLKLPSPGARQRRGRVGEVGP